MSFGDGMAVSIGSGVNGEKIINPDGMAMVYTAKHTTVTVIPTPLDNSIQNFEKSTNVLLNPINFERIKYNEGSVFVENKVHQNQTFSVCNREILYQKQVTVTGMTPNSSILKASAQVIDVNDTNKGKYIIQYLNLRSDKFNIQTTQVYVAGSTVNKINNKYHVCYISSKLKILNNRRESTVYVLNIDAGKMIVNPKYMFVENRVSQKITPTVTVSPVTANVDDFKPPTSTTGGGTASNGEGLKSFYIVVQKYSYFEQALSFTNVNVKDIIGLPQGMIYELGYLKGSPTCSGSYPISIKFDDGTSLSGLLAVTNLPREL